MSKSYTQETRFVHDSDCVQSGCPGHKFKLKINHTIDYVTIVIDGEEYKTLPKDILKELIRHWESQ